MVAFAIVRDGGAERKITVVGGGGKVVDIG
jgi:hypothetical protein